MNLKLKIKLIIGFLCVLAFTATVSMVAYFKINSLSNDFNEVSILLERIGSACDLKNNISMQSAAARGYFVYGTEKFTREFDTYYSYNREILQDLYQKARRQENKDWAEKTLKLNDQYHDFVKNKVFPLIAQGKIEEASEIAAKEGLPLIQPLMATAQEYYTKRYQEIAGVSKTSVSNAEQTQRLIMLLGLSALLIGLVLSLWLAQSITRPVEIIIARAGEMAEGDLTKQVSVRGNDEIGRLGLAFNQMVDNLKQLVERIVENGNNLAAHSEELSASAQEVSANMQDIVGTTAGVAASAEEGAANSTTAVEMAGRVLEVAREGNEAVKETVAKMGSIKDTVDKSAAAIRDLGERSRQIGQIIDIINGIAGQTNLLALNAAIEAARAGEQGRGFAVVAEEVRQLAEQSAASTREIAAIISNIQADTGEAVTAMERGAREVNEGVQIVDRAGKSLEQILEAINKSVEVIKQIAAGADESSKGSQRLAGAAEQVSGAVDQIAGAAQSLAKMAQDLQEQVAKFRV
ncbi:MAG: HAMP domain-containing protein [Firmicutes bacterium]|nr:HAMP domain-containing protein [Bacillota bacterium]